jgi:hypothetical protein
MTDRQLESVLTRARQLVARARELKESRTCLAGRREDDVADLFGVSQVQDSFRRLRDTMADKGLTLAERVKVAQTFLARAPRRLGRPRKGDGKKRKAVSAFPWVKLEKGMRTEDAAALAAGFGSRVTLRAAVAVVDAGLASEVDAGRLSLFEAARKVKRSAAADNRAAEGTPR